MMNTIINKRRMEDEEQVKVVKMGTYADKGVDKYAFEVVEELNEWIESTNSSSDELTFTVPKEWFEKWCAKNNYSYSDWFNTYTLEDSEKVFEAAEDDGVLKVIEVDNVLCKKYLKAKFKVDELIQEFGQAVLDVTEEYLSDNQIQNVRDAIMEHGESGFLGICTYGSLNVSLECEKNNELVIDLDTLMLEVEETFPYFIKLEINFGEYGETSSYVFRSSYSDEFEAAEEFAQQYYEIVEEEDGKYSVNGDFYYTVGTIKHITEEEYAILNKYL